MDITYYGHSCFLLRSKETTLLTDPYSDEIGLKLPRLLTDIVTVSHGHYDHNNVSVVHAKKREEVFVVNGPGEYEIAGVSVFGLATHHDRSQGKERGSNTIYVVSLDRLKLVHLGDLGHLLTDEQLEEVNGVDILFVPVGGTYTINAKEAVEVIAQIEPRIIIPMHYQAPNLKIKLASVDDFLKEMGVGGIRPIEKLTVSREKLPDEREIVVLNAKA